MITIFEKFEIERDKPNLDVYSDDLWRLIKIANWQKLIDIRNNLDIKKIEQLCNRY